MKKQVILGAVLAAFTAFGCSEVETSFVKENQTIGFDAFLSKPSRATTTPSTLGWDNFTVFGQFESTNVFNGVSVTYNSTSGAWEYSPLVPWVPNKDYVFGAVAPATPGATFNYASKTYSLPGTITLDQETQNDLLTATPVQVTSAASNNDVQFTFNHISSLLAFTFEVDKETANAWDGEIYITITGFRMSNIKKKATYTNSEWGNYDAELATFTTSPNITTSYDDDLVIGTSTRMFYVLPQALTTQQVLLTCKITDQHGNIIRDNLQAKANMSTATLTEWQPGYKYTYNFLLGKNLLDDGTDVNDIYIMFDVSALNGWTETSVGVETSRNDN